MKTRGWLVAAILSILASYSCMSQCGTPQTISYDTTVIGTGSNEDDPFIFTFPMFNGGTGTLSSVNISAVVSLNYDYNVENTDAVNKAFKLKVTRFDAIYIPSLGSFYQYDTTYPNEIPLSNPANWYLHNLSPSDGITGSGSDYASNSLDLNTSINLNLSPADFIGAGNISFEYYTGIGTNTQNGSGTQFNSTSSDQITYTITYTYCDNIVLNSVNNPRIIRTVERQDDKHRLFPNPSINGNFSLQFHHSIRGDWQVEVFSASGQLISQKKFTNVTRADINNSNLSKGIYIIKATNLKSRESFVERLLVK